MKLKGGRHIYQRFLVWLGLLFTANPVLANLPKPPDIPGENSNNYVEMASNLGNTGSSDFLTLLFVGGIICYVIMLISLMRQAKRDHDWGPAIIGGSIGLVFLVIILILLNIGKSTVNTST